MKEYVYFAIVATLGGCAYGVTPEQEISHHDGGIIKVDAGGAKDANATVQDAGAADTSIDLPDVAQQTQCASLPLGTGMPTCDSCLSTSCCNEDQTCGFDQDCAAFIDCTNTCFPDDGGPPDQTCFSSCETSYPNGANELSSLDSCMQTSCENDCF